MGKTCILGLGYGTGALKLQHTLKTQPPGATVTEDEAKESGRIEYKIEQQLDLRNQDGQIIIECTLNRDGPKGVQVPLIKVLKNPANEHSFTFRLQEEERVGF